MKLPFFRRCGHAPGALTPEDQAVVDQFRATLTAVRDPQPWTPGHSQDIAVRIGPFIERAHPRPGDDHGPEMIAVALVHPDTPHAAAYLHGRQLGYTDRGWLRCETTAILGTWQPAYRMLTHAAAGLDLPDDVGLQPAHYAVHVSRPDCPLVRLGPYNQCTAAESAAVHINEHLKRGGLPGEATVAPLDFGAVNAYHDPNHQCLDDLLVRNLRAASHRDVRTP
ncbi:hypothetical protein [Streptomyces cuspidosporus]|uniref:Uncharacterized protein n=1 Tax=Streptomyces cuspidosporus TaxID=66882 RepID=A0ABP5TU17_9ACTN